MPTNTSGGTTTSLSNTPQATDNSYTASEDCISTFDVMADDLGGNAKILWSIDDNDLYGTTTTSADGTTVDTTSMDSTIDLTIKDCAGVVEKSMLGASIWIENGKVKYDSSALDWLAEGEPATDYFTYAIRLSNGTLSWARVEVKLTGTNDRPTIVAAATDGAGAVNEKAEPGEGGTLSDSGTITFADVDLKDTHGATVSATVVDENENAVSVPLGQLQLGLVDQATNTVTWTYSVNDADLDFLAAGETRKQVYTVTISDGHTGGTVTQTVTVVITGTNDAPMLSVDASGELTEDESASLLGETGTLSFTDVDESDTHAVTSESTGVSWSGGTLDPADAAALAAGFSADADSWDYSVANSAVQFLAAGETLTLTYAVTVTDNHGGSDTETVTVTITGTNDKPVIEGGATGYDVAGSVTEIADGATGENATNHSTSGLITFSDVDLTDTHTATLAAAGEGYVGTFALTDADAETAGMQTGAGSLGWSFTVADSVLDDLAAGQVLTQTYTVTIDDGHGGAVSQQVTVTITGTNDAPTVSAVSTSASEDGSTVPGSFVGDDVDSDDDGTTLTYEITSQPSGGSVINNGDGTFAFDPGDDFQDLAAGETRQVTFTYTATDRHDATSTSGRVTVTVTGTNDPPTLTVGDVSGELSEEDASATLSDGGALSFDDVDATDVVTVSASYNGDIDWSGGTLDADLADAVVAGFEVDQDSWDYSSNQNLDFLAEGETITFSFDVVATDDSGTGNAASEPRTVTITITGTNDAPVLTGDASGELTEDESDPLLSETGTLSFTDVDVNDEHDVTSVSTGVTWSGGTLDPALAAALAAGFSADASGWDYSVANSAVQFLDTDEVLTLTFDVTVTDDKGGSDTEAVTITISGANDAPVAEDGSASGDEDAAEISGSVSATDADGEGLTYVLVDGVAAGEGVLTFNSNGTYTFVPAENFNGEVTFTYKANDGTVDSEVATVTLTVDPVNDVPELAGPQAELADGLEDTAFTVTETQLLQGFADVDGDTLSVASPTATNATVVDNEDGTYTVTPAANFAGTVTLNYSVEDGNGGSVAASNMVFVDSVNDPATFDGIFSDSVTEATDGDGGVPTASGSVTVKDVDELNPFFQQVVEPELSDEGYGTFTVSQTGTWTYTLNNDHPDVEALDDLETLEDTFVIRSADGTEQVITITIKGATDADIAADDLVYLSSGTNGATISLSALLGNDASGVDPLTFVITSGNATYDPVTQMITLTSSNPGPFTYEVSNGTETDSATVAVSVVSITGTDNVVDLSEEDYAASYIDLRNGEDEFTGSTVVGSVSQDTVFGGTQNDDLSGNEGNDILDGGAGLDSLQGGEGNDRLIGGAGSDTLTGGNGDDTFVFLTPSTGTGGGIDTVFDFGNGNDIIDLTAMDANGAVSGNQDFKWGGTTATANGVWYSYDASTNTTTVFADTNGSAGSAEFTLVLSGYNAGADPLQPGDFDGLI